MPLFLLFAFGIAVLGKSADLLVEVATELAEKIGIPPLVIGATIVSLGTTLPEIVVSALAAAGGKPGIALGNAVGSVICDTGLIMGIAILLGNIPVRGPLISRQANLQIVFPAVLIFLCAPNNWSQTLTQGGHLSQKSGLILVLALLCYLYLSYRWSQVIVDSSQDQAQDEKMGMQSFFLAAKMIIAAILLILSSDLLVTCAAETARRFAVPEMVIAQSLVAFGTSLPELVTAVTAVRRGQGELALGNIIGADILNILGVVGIATAIQPAGLPVEAGFFSTSFPIMMLILLVFRIGLFHAKQKGFIHKSVGILLLALYSLITLSHWVGGTSS